MIDNRDTEIHEGDTVAFNISGQVAVGEIVALTKASRYGRPITKIEVRLDHKAAGHPAGHISTVTNPRNVIVLKDKEQQAHPLHIHPLHITCACETYCGDVPEDDDKSTAVCKQLPNGA